jgi:hypothetical protein
VTGVEKDKSHTALCNVVVYSVYVLILDLTVAAVCPVDKNVCICEVFFLKALLLVKHCECANCSDFFVFLKEASDAAVNTLGVNLAHLSAFSIMDTFVPYCYVDFSHKKSPSVKEINTLL